MTTTEELKTFSVEEINQIINLKAENGQTLNVFNLHGVLYLGDRATEDSFVQFSEHSLSLSIEDFAGCQTAEEVKKQFNKCLRETILQKLI